jgi:hypothetical protein
VDDVWVASTVELSFDAPLACTTCRQLPIIILCVISPRFVGKIQRVIGMVSLRMEFVRDLVLEMRCAGIPWKGMPWKGGPHSKTQHIAWMGRYATRVKENGTQNGKDL